MSCCASHLIRHRNPEHTVAVIHLQWILLRRVLPALLFSVAIAGTAAAEDALELRLRVERAEALVEQARGFLRDGQYADAQAAAQVARTLILSLPPDTGLRLRALQVDPEQHRRREPPDFSRVEQASPPTPAGIREAARTGTPVLNIDVAESVVQVYDARRNPWNGDLVYLYNETVIRERGASSTLRAGINIVRSTSEEPFDLRAMEIQIASRRYRYGFPDDTVQRTRDDRWYRELVSIPLDDALLQEIADAIDISPIYVILEGNEDRLSVLLGRSERDGVRRMIEWANSDSDAN